MPFGIRSPFGYKPPQEEEEDPFLVDRLVQDFSAQLPEPDAEIQTPVFERYLEEIQNAPRREDYEVGTGKKILAGIAGAATGFTSGAGAGAKTIQDITEGPYQRAQRDFKDRIEPLEKGVGFEKHFAETLRKSQNDHNKYGSNLAKIEADKDRALAQIQIMKQRANTDEARQEADEAHKSVMAQYYQLKAENDRGNVRARQTAADAAMIRANRPPGTGSLARPRFIDPKKSMEAEAFAAKDGFEATMDEMPSLKAAGTITFDKGKITFPKDLDPRIKEKFLEIHKAKTKELANQMLNRRYE